MYYKLIPYFFQSHQKVIKLFFQGLVLVAINDATSYAMDESESSSSLASSAKSANCELTDTTPEECTFADWILSIGRNAFNKENPEDQQRIKKKVARDAFQIAGLICERTKQQNQEKIAGYIRQIANDENPINENPAVAMTDKNNPNYGLVTEIATVLYKVVTGQIPLINGKLADRKMLAYINPNLIALQREGVTFSKASHR